jgi:nucleotide-binding universal stress UspA family protein
MFKMKKILIGVDIDRDGNLADGSKAAVEKALHLAQRTEVVLFFAHVVDVPPKVRQIMGMQPQSDLAHQTTLISELLSELAAKAGVEKAGSGLLFGKHWEALIAEVERGDYDLVLLGTRGRNVTGRALFGSTGNKLLRYCPCPVWTVKPSQQDQAAPVLVAHDLSDIGALALQMGADITRLEGRPLHALHVLEHPEEKQFLGSVSADELNSRTQLARIKINQQCQALGLVEPATICISNGDPHVVILEYANRHGVDLLCMGTVARTGLSGFITGNTAENVLPWLQCSLLAVKPARPAYQRREPSLSDGEGTPSAQRPGEDE